MGFGKDGKGAILRENQVITLSTLANGTAIKAASQLAIAEDFRIIKSEYFMSYEGFTQGEGPVYIGIADNELSVAEIAECVGAEGPLDRNDNLATERANRPVWLLAQLTVDKAYGTLTPDGMPYEKVLRWTFSNADGWTFFAINKSGSALTTGTVIYVHAKHFGVWVT